MSSWGTVACPPLRLLHCLDVKQRHDDLVTRAGASPPPHSASAGRHGARPFNTLRMIVALVPHSIGTIPTFAKTGAIDDGQCVPTFVNTGPTPLFRPCNTSTVSARSRNTVIR